MMLPLFNQLRTVEYDDEDDNIPEVCKVEEEDPDNYDYSEDGTG